jgi:hypothetical protein
MIHNIVQACPDEACNNVPQLFQSHWYATKLLDNQPLFGYPVVKA